MPNLYWSWIRHVASEEGVQLPQGGSASDALSNDQAKRLASALRIRADKIRRGVAPRDATAYVRAVEKSTFPPNQDLGSLQADFDDPDSMDESASFFDSSGGVTLSY